MSNVAKCIRFWLQNYLLYLFSYYLQNRERRLTALRNARPGKFSVEECKCLRQALKDNTYISSDESHTEDEQKVFKVKELQWRSTFLTESFKYLDRKGRRSSRDRRRGLCVPRRRELFSERDEPANAPEWAVAPFVEASGEESE